MIGWSTARGGIITPAVADRVSEMNSRFTIAHIAGTGHHIRFEYYTEYMEAVRSFLETTGA